MNIYIFSNQILLKSIYLVYINEDGNADRFNARKYQLSRGIIDNYNIINRKHFMTKKTIQINQKINQKTRGKLDQWVFIRLRLCNKSLQINSS